MKKLILTCILTICLIVSLALCLTVYADDTPESTNTSSAEATTTSQVDVVRDMINALPEKQQLATWGIPTNTKRTSTCKQPRMPTINFPKRKKIR